MSSFVKTKKLGQIGFLSRFLAGLVLPILALFFIAVPTVDAAGLTCEGNYACFTQAACQRSNGDFVACPNKCDTEGRSGRGFCYARNRPVSLSVRIGGLTQAVDLAEYIEAIYRYSVGIAAIAAIVMIMIGGIQWMTAADSGRSGKAKERIVNSSVGLLLVIFAYVILKTINPALVHLQMPRIPLVRQESVVRCELFKMDFACGQRFGVIEREDATPAMSERERFQTVVDVNAAGVIAECVGGSCSAAGFDDGSYTCQTSSSSSAQPSSSSSATPTGGNPAIAGSSSAGIGTGSSAAVVSNSSTSPTGAGVGAGYQCLSCTGNGQPCRGLGPCSSCCGGYCGATSDSAVSVDARVIGSSHVNQLAAASGGGVPGGLCSNGMNGVKCGSADECRGGRCVDVSDYWQGLTDVQNITSGIRDIFSGILGGDIVRTVTGLRSTSPLTSLANVWAGGMCSNGAVGAPCNNDADCGGDMICLDSFGAHICSRPIIGGYCTENSHCGTNGRCQTDLNFCFGVNKQETCDTDSHCSERYGEGYVCRSIEHRKICINGEPGSLCTANSYCDSGKCYQAAITDRGDPDRGICISGEEGSGCDNDTNCLSGVCYDHEGFGKICVGGPQTEAGSPCIPARGGTQCGAGLTCSTSSQTCVPPPPNSAGAGTGR